MPAGSWLGTRWHVAPLMTSGRGSPLPAATALGSRLSPEQKKRDLCEQWARPACAVQPGVLPAHGSGCNLWTKTTAAVPQGLTLSCYIRLLTVWKGKGAAVLHRIIESAVLPICAFLTKPRSRQLANFFFFFKFHISLFLNVLSPGSVFLGNSCTIS